jgi:demethylmenaquinone methyltransferase/2-methoxy-6-polyprenyl-1,4-benzoquinol methylase
MNVIGSPMRDYYERRAREYDDWWLGTGLFARRERPGWHEEVAALTNLLGALPPARTLDVACGTGFLTRHLPGEITAVDQSPKMVEIARSRMPHATVVAGEAVPLRFADGAFERLVTGHFYGHLQPAEAGRFLAEARRVADELVVVDSARRPDTGAEQWQERRLNDGSEHQVYKRWFTGRQLAEELGGGTVLHDGDWFVVVQA